METRQRIMTLRHDDALLHPQDLPAALGLLTRLPVRVDTARAVARGARAAWAWPLTGICVNGIAAGVAGVILWLGLPPGVAALCLIATQIAVTGAMHEDGLADSLDGLWGGWDRDRRLAIMKDSSLGVYGVLGLGLSVLLRWQLWVLVLPLALWPVALAVGVIARWPMVALSHALPPARDKGLAHAVGRPGAATLAVATGVTAVVAVLTLGLPAVAALGAVLAVTFLWGLIARTKIGGQTGDILGAAQQFAEIAALVTLSAML